MAAPFLTEADLVDMRATQESVMLDECRVNQPDTVSFDRATSQEVATVGDLVYEGPCRIQVLGGQSADDRLAGAQPLGVRNLVAAIPFRADANTVQRGQIITVLGSSDSRLLQRRYAILSVEVSTFATARRLFAEMIEELESGD